MTWLLGIFGVLTVLTILALIFVSVNLHKMNRFAEQSYMMPCQEGGGPEWGERDTVFKYLDPKACVLEFGGGSGSVSNIIQHVLEQPANHVVIEPGGDGSMFGGLEQLRKNKTSCKSNFKIVDHILAQGEGPSVRNMVEKNFDTIVADCEGCLVGEHEKNPSLFDHVKMILVERDDAGTYNELFKTFGMEKKESGLHSDPLGRIANEVWERSV